MNIGKLHVVVFIVLVSLFMTACHNPAKEYIDTFDRFVTEIENESGKYAAEEWEKKDNKFKNFAEKKFHGKEVKLTAEEEKTVDSLIAKYNEIRQRCEAPSTPRPKPNVNVYVENSGSMDGYVKGVTGVTDFENIIYNYLSDIKISGIADSLNLFYINSEVIEFETDTSIDTKVLKDFIEKLEPETFRLRGGNRGKSDIAEVISSVLKRTGENDISILITDGIFSPGRKEDAENYLSIQETGIKIEMAGHLNNYPESMVVLYMMTSKFTGTFYDKVDNKYELNGEERPFYIWVFGQSQDIAKLNEEVPDSRFKGNGIVKKFEIALPNSDFNYRIKPQGGNHYKVDRKNPNALTDITKNQNKYVFYVEVNYSGLMFDDDYFLNPDNYKTSGDSMVSVKPETLPSNEEYSHSLTFELDKNFFPKNCKEKELKVWFNKLKDDWSDVNDDEGGRAIEGKTYGIKYQVEGISSAYSMISKEKYAEMTFKIRKK